MTQSWVDAQVVAQNGHWVVYLLVTTETGVERRRLQAHHTLAAAERMASLTVRTARRRRTLPPERE